MEVSNAPLVSVIVPVYNEERYVEACLKNLLKQTYKNLEIIVVDDGSTDKSAEIAERYSVKVIRQKNQGVSVARNRGIDAAQGEYLHFMDVDDVINSEYYEKLISAITKTNADIACSEMVNQREKNQTTYFKNLKVYTSVSDKLRITYVGRIGYVWRYLFKTEFLKAQGLRFEEGRIVEDLMFSLTAVFYAKVLVVVPGATYTYVYRENSQLTTASQEQLAKRNRDWEHVKALRSAFAEKYSLKIPGVNSGKLAYTWWKIKNLYLNKR